jgi:glycosyltransferase involved in cell wall biosynthesis
MESPRLGKILQIIDGKGWGGTKDQMLLLTQKLHERNMHVEVALSKQFEELKDRLRSQNIPFFEYQDTEKKSKLRDGKNLADIINKGNYQFAIANSPMVMNQFLWARPFVKNKPYIIAVKRSGRMSSFISKILKYSYADKIVVVSEQVKQRMEKENFLPKRLITIQSGIELSLYHPSPENRIRLREELGIREDKKVFIQVANWNEKVKAQPQLMESFSRLKAENALLVLAGYETDTKGNALAKELGIEDRFLGLGFRHDIHQLLDLADFYVLSSNLEGIAGSLLQAMAKGKVVLSTLAGGIGEYLHDGINGFAVEVGDFDSYTERMKRMLSLSEREYNTITDKAKATAINYSIDNTTNKYIDLFKTMANGKS